MMTSEQKWLDFLKRKPIWLGPQGKTIVLSPHPDDETLGAGGLIADLRKENREIHIVAITDGENAYPNIKNLREIRQQEQEKALHILGVSKDHITRLGLMDSSVKLYEEQLKETIAFNS